MTLPASGLEAHRACHLNAGVDDDVSLASDFADFRPADSTVRLEARADGLRRRLETLER
jgi:hypothetical protein